MAPRGRSWRGLCLKSRELLSEGVTCLVVQTGQSTETTHRLQPTLQLCLKPALISSSSLPSHSAGKILSWASLVEVKCKGEMAFKNLMKCLQLLRGKTSLPGNFPILMSFGLPLGPFRIVALVWLEPQHKNSLSSAWQEHVPAPVCVLIPTMLPKNQ